MTLDALFRGMLRDEIRAVVREEIGTLSRPTAEESRRSAELLTIGEVAEACHATPATVREWIGSGRLAARKAGRRYLVKPIDVDRFLARKDRKPDEPDVEGQVSSILDRLDGCRG